LKNILIAPGTTLVAKEIHDSLILSKEINLFGAGYLMPEDVQQKFNYDGYAYLPALDEEGVLGKLNEILEKFKIDFIFFAHDEWIYRFKDTEKLENSYVCKHPSETIDIASFKSRTYKHLKHLGFTPDVYRSLDSAIEYPFIIKPDRGQGAKGFIRVDNDRQLEAFLSQNVDLNEVVISEFLPGEERTVDCFTDKNGSLLFASCRIRSVIENGLSSTTQIDTNPELLEMALEINSQLSFKGAWFFQVRNDSNNAPKLLEIGCRVAGASGVQRAIGVNLSELWLYTTQDLPVSVLKNYLMPRRIISDSSTVFLNQHFDQIYVDFDDCLFVKGSLNIGLLRFLEAEKSKNVDLILISRHRGNLKSKVDALGIGTLFTHIHHILDNSRKSAYFSRSGNILFIDDSYAERSDLADFTNVKSMDPSIFNGHVTS
jgi:predicted ATP-grasp superfamily ATP-dependent carboligase